MVHSDFFTHDNDPFNEKGHWTGFAILAMFDLDDIMSTHKPTIDQKVYVFVGMLSNNWFIQKMLSGILCDPVLLDEK